MHVHKCWSNKQAKANFTPPTAVSAHITCGLFRVYLFIYIYIAERKKIVIIFYKDTTSVLSSNSF